MADNRPVNMTTREREYALLLREVKPLVEGRQLDTWRKLVDLIANDYVRPSHWHWFKETAERGA